MVPRASPSAVFDRTGGSTASQPGGSRKRRSRPLALTDLISHAHAYPPDSPWPRANPVMLDSAIAKNFRFAGPTESPELSCGDDAPQAARLQAVGAVGTGSCQLASCGNLCQPHCRPSSPVNAPVASAGVQAQDDA